MKSLLFVGIGSFLGGITRYLVGGAVLHHFPDLKFPLGTFLVNFIGCFLIGLIAGYGENSHISPEVRLFLITGILGGFTTFSAFGLETVLLLNQGHYLIGLMNIFGSIIISLIAVWIGLSLYRV